MRNIIAASIASTLLLLPLTGKGTILYGCFSSPEEYTAQYEHELGSEENRANSLVTEYLNTAADGAAMEANCACPKNMYSSSIVREFNYAGSPLSAGVSGYGYLTEYVDVNVSSFGDAIDSPGASGLNRIAITQYPTTADGMNVAIAHQQIEEGKADVCSDSTRPTNSATVKRQFKASGLRAYFLIKKPILGEEIIPNTLVVQAYSCLIFNAGSCTFADSQHVSNIWLSGKITAPLSCTINAGSTIEVDLGSVINSQFVSPGQPPKSYALKEVNISYHCDSPAVANDSKIKLTLTADQGVVDGSQSYIAKLVNRSDLGIRLFDTNDDNIVLDGSADFPVILDEQGNGTLNMKAAPVSTTTSKPEPGSFEGNMTVKMDLR